MPSRAVVVALVVLSAPLAAQQPTAPADSLSLTAPRWHFGVAANLGRPLGRFKQQVGHAGGAQGHLRVRLDQAGRVSLRMQAGWLNYGHESHPICLASTPGCRVKVNATTANGILALGVGPEISYPLGRLRAYGHGLVGVSRFATVTGIGGGLMPDMVAGDENFGDSGFAWSAGAGVELPITQRTTVDVGVAYHGHGEREYLTKGGITDNADGSLSFNSKRSTANVFAMRLGVTTSLGWGTRKTKS
ncbi:MAG: outer membrane beta-barrel protein [Gemmatimonadaceae bacterium]|nr:outer membrane beta-barrel protein [Gemmatimonadaceae bacterium]